MPVKSITSSRTLKLGRNRPIGGRKLKLGDYLNTETVGSIPSSVNYGGLATAAIRQMYLNDQLGDCVIAGIAHLVGVFTANAKRPEALYTDAQITALYSAIGGYVPDNPATDQGCDEQTALNYWMNTGAPAGSHRIHGWVSVDANNLHEVQTALYLFENLVFGIELPDAWINPAPAQSGFIWDTSSSPADPANGHCVVGFGYDSTGVNIATWGMTGTITDTAVAQYAGGSSGGELYTVVSHDAICRAANRAPNGVKWGNLLSDLGSV